MRLEGDINKKEIVKAASVNELIQKLRDGEMNNIMKMKDEGN